MYTIVITHVLCSVKPAVKTQVDQANARRLDSAQDVARALLKNRKNKCPYFPTAGMTMAEISDDQDKVVGRFLAYKDREIREVNIK